jgi:DNA repair protein RecO (recombination protein O)
LKQVDRGVVLRKINYSDSSLILTIFTEENGLQKFIFQGAKKKASALYPLSIIEFSFYKRPDSELGKMTSAESFSTSEIPFDPIRSTLAFFLADVFFHCIKTEERDSELFSFIRTVIEKIDDQNEKALIPLTTMIGLTRFLGIEPQVIDSGSTVFMLEDGEITNSGSMGAITEQGPHVELIRDIILDVNLERTHKEVRMNALQLMIKYFKVHIPGFEISRSLEILTETLA